MEWDFLGSFKKTYFQILRMRFLKIMWGPAPFANSKVKYMHTMEGKDDSLSFDFSGVK